MDQLTHNMTTDCSLNCKFNTWKFQAQNWAEHVVYRNCFWYSEQFLYTNMFSPCWTKRRASDKDLPVLIKLTQRETTLIRISQSSPYLALTRDLNLIVWKTGASWKKESSILGDFALNGSSLGSSSWRLSKESFFKDCLASA